MLCAVFFLVRWCVHRRKTVCLRSSESAKTCPTKRQNQFLKVVRCRKKLSNEATKSILKSRLKPQETVQQSDKTNSQKSSAVVKNCSTKRQNQFFKVVRCRKKLSNEATKPIFKVVRCREKLSNEATNPIFKSRPMSQKIAAVELSNEATNQFLKSSPMSQNCPTKRQANF